VGDVKGWAGFGRLPERAEFWCGVGAQPPQPSHVAFTVGSREDVQAFFDHALAQGAVAKSAPALFTEYHAGFYAAMVYDPDGHNVEVVCHTSS
jgi:predicted lactoylglutathione lyase